MLRRDCSVEQASSAADKTGETGAAESEKEVGNFRSIFLIPCAFI